MGTTEMVAETRVLKIGAAVTLLVGEVLVALALLAFAFG